MTWELVRWSLIALIGLGVALAALSGGSVLGVVIGLALVVVGGVKVSQSAAARARR